MERVFGWARVLADAAPAPGATVTVYNAGTVVLASIFADNIATPKANPFTADAATAYWFFYAANGRYDIKFSGGGIAAPYTLSDVLLLDTAAGGYIQTLNAQGQVAQTLVAGNAGADFAIASVLGVHTFNLPNAGVGVRGLVSTGIQTFAGAKSFQSPIGVSSGGLGVGTVPANGQVPIGNGANYVAALLTAGSSMSIVNGAGSITIDTIQDLRATATPTFDQLTLSGLVDADDGQVLTLNENDGLISALPMRDGELLIGATGFGPQPTTLTVNAGLSMTPGPWTIQLANTGVLSLGGITGAIALSVGGGGSDVTWVPGATTTLNVPDAGVAARGVVNATVQTLGGVKTFVKHPLVVPGSAIASTTPGRVAVGFKTDGTITGSVLAVETTLDTVSLDGGTLDTDFSSRLIVRAWGITAANANSKNIRLYFGAAVICQLSNATLLNNMAWYMEAFVRRTGATSQEALGRGQASTTSTATLGLMDTRRSNPGETLSGAVTIRTTGLGVATNDVIGTGIDVEVLY